MKNAKATHQELCVTLSQEVFDVFVRDLERGLREIGFGDTSVHKRKKKLVHSYYGLIDEFDPVLTSRNLVRLSQNVATRFLTDLHEPQLTNCAMLMGKYILAAGKSLRAQSDEAMLSGKFNWPQI